MICKSSLRSYIQSSNILECPICLQDYNQTTRQPMIVCINFQTIHTICSDCVSKKAFTIDQKTKSFNCSICRKPINQKQIKKHQYLLQWIKLTQKLQIKFQKDKQFYQNIIQNTKDQKQQLKQQIQALKKKNQKLSQQTQLLRAQIKAIINTKQDSQVNLNKKHQVQIRQKQSRNVKLQREIKQLQEKLQKQKNGNEFMQKLKQAKNKQSLKVLQVKNNFFSQIYQQQKNSTSLLLGRQNINDQKLFQFVSLDWPKLQTLYLDGNQLTEFDQLAKIKNLKLLRVDQNNLGKRSVQKIVNVKFYNLTHLLISFASSQSNQCWQILTNNKFHSFPSLKMLRICGSKYILDKPKQRIKQWSEIDRNGKISIVWFQ